jgi:hypothetical protein
VKLNKNLKAQEVQVHQEVKRKKNPETEGEDKYL